MKISKEKQNTLTHERLVSIFAYNPETGTFTRRKNGSVTKTINAAGYRMLMIDRKVYYQHRLAWFYMHGVWPDDIIDHINGVKDDNRIINLRVANKSINSVNCAKSRAKSGLRGVYYQSNTLRWRVKCGQKNIGYFDTKEEAHEAYRKAVSVIYGEEVLKVA